MKGDDTILIGTEDFFKLEDTKIKEAKIKAKNISRLTEKNL